jgi:tetratricopeptide (TPR) repeat protein
LGDFKRYADAVDCYDRAAELNPKDPRIWSNRGNALNMLGRNLEVVESHNKSIELDPSNTKFWNNKIMVLIALAEYAKALECLEKSIRLDPFNSKAWHNRASSMTVWEIKLRPKSALGNPSCHLA